LRKRKDPILKTLWRRLWVFHSCRAELTTMRKRSKRASRNISNKATFHEAKANSVAFNQGLHFNIRAFHLLGQISHRESRSRLKNTRVRTNAKSYRIRPAFRTLSRKDFVMRWCLQLAAKSSLTVM